MNHPPDHAERLYGRRRHHTLRARQQTLLAETLPRLRFNPDDPGWWTRWSRAWLEIGAGGGEHAQALAQTHPDAGLIACEIYVNGLCSLLSRLVAPGAEATDPLPENLRLWDDDARPLLRRLPDAALDAIFLMFPDPWPKNRHAGRRFVSTATIAEAARVLKPGGVWRIATDDPSCQAWVADHFQRPTPFAAPPPLPTRPEAWPPTRYEAKALRAGRQPLYWTITRH